MTYDDVVRVSPRWSRGFVDEQMYGQFRGEAGAEYVEGMPPMRGGGYYDAPPMRGGGYYDAPQPSYYEPPPPPPSYYDNGPRYYAPPPPPQYYRGGYEPEIIPRGPMRGGDVYVDQGPGGHYSDDFIRRPAAGERLEVTVHDPDPPKPSILKQAFKGGVNTAATLVGVAGFLSFWAGVASIVFGSRSFGGAHMPSVGHSGPGTLLVGGVAAMLGAGAVWHWNNPKK